MEEKEGAAPQGVAPTPIDILLPVHGRPDLTVSAVKSIYQYTTMPFHLIVLDDTDASIEQGSFHAVDPAEVTSPYFERLVKQHDNITYHNHPHPWKEGNEFFNVGLKYCKHDFVATIMNSITVMPDWERHAIELFKEYPELGIIGLKNIFPNGTIESAGILFHGSTPIDNGRDTPGYCFTMDIEMPAVQWAFAIHRKSALLGNLEEGVFHGHVGWDDIDNCLAIRDKGWKVLYCGHGVGTHQTRATRGTNANQASLMNKENAYAFYKRWGFWKTYQEANKLDVSYKLKPETKETLTRAVLEYQVLQTLLTERQAFLRDLTGVALAELGSSPEKYYLEMNPQKDVWDLKMIPDEDNGKKNPKKLKETVKA
ncbi:hypothetical protein LCGC14_1361460 [marine sediment metagenome]|uniref:Glycosyltransferase 2-like domain-containing protein n=1 Tax=marine sediment metagenome TaxID=412755 RepID=A0A0F9NAA1_9ZZZZ